MASAPSPPAPAPAASPAPVPAEDKREPQETAKPTEPSAPRGPETRAESRPAAPPAREASTPGRPETPGQEPRVASVPRSESGGTGGGRAKVPDIRSALRASPGGGAPGGRGDGRGGIEGEPIPLDSSDPRYNDYLDRIRRMIKANWGYPCVKNLATRECEYKSAQLIVEFGILKNGRLQFIEVRQPSGLSIYDDYAVNAIKLASPFPDVPPSMVLAVKADSAGIAILARFSYVLETSLTNILR